MSTAHGSSIATSRSLIARVRSNDPEAWDRLVELYAPFVFRTCRHARLSSEDTADVFQEVFQAAFAKIATFEKRDDRDTFRGWLRTITRHKVADLFRRQMREPRGVGGTEIQARLASIRAPEASESSGASEKANVEDQAELLLFRRALEGICQHFKERTWQAFLGTVVDGRSPADVGEELAMTAGAVRVAKSRVLQRLRAELGDTP